jgi:hypothetical protein
MSERRFQDVWIDQCAVTRRIREEHGVKSAFDYLVGEKLMTYAQAAVTRPEFSRELPRFVAEVRRIFSADEIREHLRRIEREDAEATEAASGEEIDDIDDVARPEDVAAERARFAALKELLLAEQLGLLPATVGNRRGLLRVTKRLKSPIDQGAPARLLDLRKRTIESALIGGLRYGPPATRALRDGVHRRNRACLTRASKLASLSVRALWINQR